MPQGLSPHGEAAHRIRDIDGDTPVDKACEAGHLHMLQFLIHSRRDMASLETKNANGKTPLDVTVENGHGEIAVYFHDILPNKRISGCTDLR
mmetsp:Transcript_17641/g.48973  ORF Transcript_17641/g.48973 Transcript_17641/m.48973 type:complete len:92 (+) Transcript_17641:745-1020(+)